MIQLLYGPDRFAINAILTKAQAECTGEYKTVTEDGIRDFIANLGSSSFFAEKRVFVANEIASSVAEKQFEALTEALKNLDQNTDVYFIESSKPKSVKFTNLIKKYGTVKEFAVSKNLDLATFIKQEVAKAGGTIAPLATERLAGFVGPNLWQLSEEVKKLVLYKKGERGPEEIQTADVEMLVHANFEATIFELTDAIAAKNRRKAATLINSFLKDGENEIYLLTMITRQFRNIALAKFSPNITAAELAKTAGIHPYVAGKSLSQARNFDKKELKQIYVRLEDADLKLKSGANPAQTLLRLIA